MKIAFFDTHGFERKVFEKQNLKFNYTFLYLDTRLTEQTADLAKGCDVVCSFANDHVTSEVVKKLKSSGVKLLALRCAGYNQVDLKAAREEKMPVVRVPAYSPYAIAEHTMALILSLNRHITKAHNRVREGNFSLEGLVGFDLHGKTVGILGTGKIGSIFANIALGFGCVVLAYDSIKNPELEKRGVKYVSLDSLFGESQIFSLHVPLTPETRHIINDATISKMKKGVMLINTGRGALIETKALIKGLKSGQIGQAGLDVYEEEEGVFFNDLSDRILQDDFLARLLTFPNVLITSHQAFLTEEALHNIAETTLTNIQSFSKGNLVNQVL